MKTSQESSHHMKEDFAAIFNAIDQKLEEIKQKSEGNINLSA